MANQREQLHQAVSVSPQRFLEDLATWIGIEVEALESNRLLIDLLDLDDIRVLRLQAFLIMRCNGYTLPEQLDLLDATVADLVDYYDAYLYRARSS